MWQKRCLERILVSPNMPIRLHALPVVVHILRALALMGMVRSGSMTHYRAFLAPSQILEQGHFRIYSAPTQNAHPHDGLNVDTQNRIWFTEEFANKLAKAVQNGAPTPTPSASMSPSPGVTPSPSPTLSPVTNRDTLTFTHGHSISWNNAGSGYFPARKPAALGHCQ